MKKIPAEKNRSSWMDILITCTILSLIVGGSYLIFLSKKSSSASTKNTGHAATSIPTTVDTIDSKYPGIKINTEISNDPDTPVAVQYPQSTDETFNTEIKKYIKQAKDHYSAEITAYKEIGEDITGELNISFKTFSHHSGMYSFILETYSYVGGANGETEIQSFYFNPKTGESITIEDIFENDVNRLSDISEAIREQLYNDPKIKDYLFSDEVSKHTEPIWNNFQKFALTDDSLIFYFNKYDIAAGAVGIPTASISLDKLDKLLATEFKMKEEKAKDNTKETAATEKNNGDKDELDTNEKDMTSENKRVALTFDDGPDPKVTTQILETLKKYDAKATFFMLGSRVEYYPDIAKNVQAAGHELGNHTWTHPNLVKASAKKISNEINNTSTIIEDVTGQKATSFRPPYGAFNDTVSEQSDLPIILWDVDTLDWKHRNPNQLLAYVKQSTKDGSIILMHDIHQSTADGLDAVLAYLKDEGYEFVTVSQLNE